jgi:hypothetical protein
MTSHSSYDGELGLVGTVFVIVETIGDSGPTTTVYIPYDGEHVEVRWHTELDGQNVEIDWTRLVRARFDDGCISGLTEDIPVDLLEGIEGALYHEARR